VAIEKGNVLLKILSMKYLILFFFVNLSLVNAIAQENGNSHFKNLYNRNLKALEDSIEKSEAKYRRFMETEGRKMDSLKHVYTTMTVDPRNHFSIYINTKYIVSNFKTFNEELEFLGFSPIENKLSSFGYGFSKRKNRFNHDIEASIILSKSSSLKNEKVSVGGGYFNYELGYDLLNLHRVHLYPQIGLSYSQTSIDYVIDSLITSQNPFRQALSAQLSRRISKRDIGFNYGAQLEYYLKYSDYKSACILSLSFGFDSPMISGKFDRINPKAVYDPKIQLITSYVEIKLKYIYSSDVFK